MRDPRGAYSLLVLACVAGCGDGGEPVDVTSDVDVELVEVVETIEVDTAEPDGEIAIEVEAAVETIADVVDWCLPDPCERGDCVDRGGGFECVCEPGFAGLRCDDCAEGFVRAGDDCVARCGNGAVDGGEQCDPGGASLLCDDACQFACETPGGAAGSHLLSTGCYFVFDAAATYAAAEATCTANAGSHLVAPTTAWEDEYAFVDVSGERWLALEGDDGGLDGTWGTGEVVDFTHFERGRPPSEVSPYCVARGERGWFEADCAEPRAFVCEVTTCGNGFTDPNEACDDANRIEGDGCDSNCQLSGCGNGVRDPSEDCELDGPGFEPGCPDTCRFACGSQSGANHTVAGDSNCYAFYFQEADATGAAALCQSLGLVLGKITDVADGEALAMYYAPAWIGLADRDDDDVFTWTDGSTPSIDAWAAGQPSDNPNDDCVELGVGGRWNDIACMTSRSVVCSSCGNGRVDDPEACDDGNPIDGDGCNSDCRFGP